MIRRLHHLRNGQSGFVVAIAAAGERAQRLRDMGLLPGVGITVMGRSPMGDLLSLRVMEPRWLYVWPTLRTLPSARMTDVAEVNPPFSGAVGSLTTFRDGLMGSQGTPFQSEAPDMNLKSGTSTVPPILLLQRQNRVISFTFLNSCL